MLQASTENYIIRRFGRAKRQREAAIEAAIEVAIEVAIQTATATASQ
jgi:hypothetical protein